MNANNSIPARPVRIRIEEIQVNGSGDAEGKDIYQLAALGEDYALFRKVNVAPGRRAEAPDLPAA